MRSVRLSVILPAHNAAPYLTSALDSVLGDLPDDSELIVVDDGSTDETGRLLEAYRGRLTALHHPEPVGPGAARNAGAAVARGELLAFHDADDVALPGRCATLVALLDAEPGVGLAFGNGIKIDLTGRALGPVIPARHVRRLKRHVGFADLLRSSFIYPQAMCIRRNAFFELAGFSTAPAEDWEFALRASLALELRFVDRPLFAYRRHAASLTMQEHDYGERMLEMLEGFLASHPEAERVAGRRAVRKALARRLARCARHRARAGDLAGAASALARASRLVPTSLRYRWRYLTLTAVAPHAPV
jgi:glycosyltransferase involved in cell wall biosynthesis